MDSTHFIFDGEKMVISPDIVPIFEFLKEIEREVEEFLGFEKRLQTISSQYLDAWEFIEFLSNKLKQNSIDFEYTLKNPTDTIAGNLSLYRPLRSEMIVIFANLETLRCLYTAYKHKVTNEEEIRHLAMKKENIRSFLNEFCLNQENSWVKHNPERAAKITAEDVQKLRNSLSHFFSVAKGISLSHSLLNDKSRQLEQMSEFKVTFISPEDLYGILKGAAILMVKKWNNDCVFSFKARSNEFKERILCVRDIVGRYGVKIVLNNQINLK